MLLPVVTVRLDLPHTSHPGYVSCVHTDFSLIQPRLPHARAIYLFVSLIELTGRRQQPQRWQRRNKETRLEKTNPDAAWREKRKPDEWWWMNFERKIREKEIGECTLQYLNSSLFGCKQSYISRTLLSMFRLLLLSEVKSYKLLLRLSYSSCYRAVWRRGEFF